MAGESINFPITADDRASSKFRDVGRAAADTAVKVDLASASLKLWDDTSIKQGKAAATSTAAAKASAKAFEAVRAANAGVNSEFDKSIRYLQGQSNAFDDLGKAAEKAAGSGGNTGLSALAGGGGLQGGGLGALIAAGVVLSPVIATVGTGLVGLGASAYGIYKPISTAAQATGGLAANLHTLAPEQQTVARGLLSLQQTFDGFQKSMEPTVLGDFNQALNLAGTLLHGIEPVAAATGKALGSALGQISAEFKSQTWQQFFAFMSSTAGPDIQLLTDNFVGLLKVLPPLLEQLQPLATTVLKDTAGILTLVSAVENAVATEHRLATEAQNNTGWFGKLANAAGQAFKELVPGAANARDLSNWLGKLADNSNASSKGLHDTGAAAATAQPPVWTLGKAITALNTDMTTLVGNLLTLQGDNVAWRQSMQAAEKQLDSNSAGLEGNSKNALANKQAIIASTNAAITFAGQQLTLGKNIGHASDTIQAQIKFLQSLHDKSAFVRSELEALRAEEQKLQAQRINQQVSVHGTGIWSIAGTAGKTTTGPRASAAGWLVSGGTPGKDSVPILAMPGETIVPPHLTPAVAPLMKAHGVPGFAAGGIVPGYSGSVGGVWPWIKGNDAATIRLIDQAVVKATLAGIRAAQSVNSAGGGFPGGRGGLGTAERAWMGAGGPGGTTAHIAGAIAGAESGWTMAIQKGQPYATTGWGPWQITPGDSEPQYGTDYALLNWHSNALAAVAKFRQAGGSFSPWTTYEDGAYLKFMDRGGWLSPGLNHVYNGTGRPEMVTPSSGGGARVVIEFSGGAGEFDQFMLSWLRRAARVSGGGDVQLAFGRK